MNLKLPSLSSTSEIFDTSPVQFRSCLLHKQLQVPAFLKAKTNCFMLIHAKKKKKKPDFLLCFLYAVAKLV